MTRIGRMTTDLFLQIVDIALFDQYADLSLARCLWLVPI